MNSCTYAVTKSYRDDCGNQIQLWADSVHGLFGVVVDLTKTASFVPCHRIINPCYGKIDPYVLCHSLGRWHLIYNQRKSTITVLPHLRAGEAL